MQNEVKDIAIEVSQLKTMSFTSAGLSAPLWVQYLENFNVVMASVIAFATALWAVNRLIEKTGVSHQ